MTETALTLHTFTAWDGAVIPGAISGLTAHTWTADQSGLFHTTTDLAAEWTKNYDVMLKGLGDMLTPLQRIEGNAEAVIENTKANDLSPTRLGALRQDLQREYDAIDAAMRVDQAKYGIDPAREFNTYTYLKMEETLQSNETLQELATQGHGTNDPVAPRYSGYTTDFQNKTDNKTFFVGGGVDNGEKAIAAFLDDVALSHAPFATVMHNGHMEQLNQNGNFEDTLTTVVLAANEDTYTRVFVASDFSTDRTAKGAEVFITHVKAAPGLPVAAPGQVTTLDGSIISRTISGLTPHAWVADSTGLFHTKSDLATEWKTAYALMQSGGTLTQMQHWQADAEAVFENTKAIKLPPAKLAAFREDTQREMDAVFGAMKIDETTLGIPMTAQFTTTSYQAMEHTLRFNETLEELSIQGHGLNGKVVSKYHGYTEDFQNRTDNSTLYTGPGVDHGEKAIAAFFDDVILTHAPYPTVLQNGHIEQLNQNGNREDRLKTIVAAANETLFTLSIHASDFTHPVKPVPVPTPVKKA